jgi:hypothetical protein
LIKIIIGIYIYNNMEFIGMPIYQDEFDFRFYDIYSKNDIIFENNQINKNNQINQNKEICTENYKL